MQYKTKSYGIRATARLTGLPAHTLRLWEQRYRALRVARTPGGHRIYSAADVERLTRLKRLVDQGHRISDLAPQPDVALAQLANDFATPAPPPGEPTRVAVYGTTLPGALRAAGQTARIAVSDHDWYRFRQACRAAGPDAMLLELPELTAERMGDLLALRDQLPGARIILVYRFARSADLDTLQARGIRALQAPVAARDLWWLLQQVPGPTHAPVHAPMQADGEPSPEPPPPRFSPEELSRLANHASAVGCECPAHLVQIVQGLNAFENYSADCEINSPEDAALHAFLRRETARARGMMEAALVRVAEAEGLDG